MMCSSVQHAVTVVTSIQEAFREVKRGMDERTGEILRWRNVQMKVGRRDGSIIEG